MYKSDEATAMFGPLSFPETSKGKSEFDFSPWDTYFCPCMFCDYVCEIPKDTDVLLSHLFQNHKLVIADAHLINGLKSYCTYWKVRFSQRPVTDFCTTMSVDSDYYYYLLSDVHPEDSELRKGLAAKRLEWVLECQRQERDDKSFERTCLFCSHIQKDSRCEYLNHLSYQHNLQLGRPDNLVFIDRLIDKIQEKMNRLQCIYCEHVFKDRVVLKEHMRKKFHKRINPKNKEYDCFFVINYLEGGKQPEGNDVEPEDAWSQWREEGTDWSDWQEEPPPIVCLFCYFSCADWDDIIQHMNTAHSFSYRFLMGSYNFYEQVKIVNFIRRETHLCRCYICKQKLETRELLLEHMTQLQHFQLPDREYWDQPEFYFSTYENDTFLSLLEDNEEDPVDKLSSSLSSSCSTHHPGT